MPSNISATGYNLPHFRPFRKNYKIPILFTQYYTLSLSTGFGTEIDLRKACSTYSAPMTLVRESVSSVLFHVVVRLLRTHDLDIKQDPPVQHEHKNTSCSDVTKPKPNLKHSLLGCQVIYIFWMGVQTLFLKNCVCSPYVDVFQLRPSDHCLLCLLQ